MKLTRMHKWFVFWLWADNWFKKSHLLVRISLKFSPCFLTCVIFYYYLKENHYSLTLMQRNHILVVVLAVEGLFVIKWKKLRRQKVIFYVENWAGKSEVSHFSRIVISKTIIILFPLNLLRGQDEGGRGSKNVCCAQGIKTLQGAGGQKKGKILST